MTTDPRSAVARQRLALFNLLVEPMAFVTRRLAAAWPERAALDERLMEGLRTVPQGAISSS